MGALSKCPHLWYCSTFQSWKSRGCCPLLAGRRTIQGRQSYEVDDVSAWIYDDREFFLKADNAKIRIKGLLPPIVPQPLARLSRHIIRETRLQCPIEIKIGPIRQPIQTILVIPSRQIRSQGEALRRLGSRGISLLVGVVNAFEGASGKDFDVGFLVIAFVEEGA